MHSGTRAANHPEKAATIMANVAPYTCPRSIDFERQLPRHGSAERYKRLLKDRYWGQKNTRIV